jgi:carbon storage regulator
MLVLRRKVGERIIIGNSIEVTVVRVRGGKVRLGFTAPLSVHVVRGEAGGLTAARAASPNSPEETLRIAAAGVPVGTAVDWPKRN